MQLFKNKLLKYLYRKINLWLAIRNNVYYGRGFTVGAGSFINAADNLTIGNDVSIGSRCWISCNGVIGDGTLIASQVGIVSRFEHETEALGVAMAHAVTLGDRDSRPRDARDRVVVGQDVWIGFGAIVLSGVEIGRGAIIGAGAVVAHDVEPYAIVVGSAARPVSQRMSDVDRKQHEDLLENGKKSVIT